MKAHWVLGIVLAVGINAHGEECNVVVYAHTGAMMPGGMLLSAESRSAAMFRRIGVKVLWRSGAVRINAADNGCGAPLVVEIDATAKHGASPGALASAIPSVEFGPCIHVYLDRVLGGRSEQQATSVLAHVLTHEVSHVLERVARHSSEGVMKAFWDIIDCQRMEFVPLAFAAEDVELIHIGIAKRLLGAGRD